MNQNRAEIARASRLVAALPLCSVLALAVDARAQVECVKPYRAIWIDDIDPEPMVAGYINNSERQFPRGELRFHLNQSRVISGTAYVRRVDGSTTQHLHRASVWVREAGALPSDWRRVPIEPEPGGPGDLLEPFESMVGALNDASVVGGGRAWNPLAPQLVTPAVWTVNPTSGAMTSTVRLGTTAQQDDYTNQFVPGLVTSLASGVAPLAGGWIGTRCGAGAPAPMIASLLGPTYPITEFGPITGEGAFPIAYQPIGRVNALPHDSTLGTVALGWLRSGNCFAPAPGLCQPAIHFNSWACHWLQDSSSWAGSAVARPEGTLTGFLFRLQDAAPSMACGFVRWFGTPQSNECEDHAAVFVDPMYSTDQALDIHDAFPADVDRPRSRAAAVSEATSSAFSWWVAGSAYKFVDSEIVDQSQYNLARGIVWQGRLDGSGNAYEWCGRRIDELCVSLPSNVEVFSITDVLPGGAGVGVARLVTGGPTPPGWGTPGGKLLLSTSAADYNGDLSVSGSDLGALLAAWGPASPSMSLDCDADVDGADLGILLSMWSSGADPTEIPWACSGWSGLTPIGAAKAAAQLLSFSDLDSLGEFMGVLDESQTIELAREGALLTQILIEGGGQ